MKDLNTSNFYILADLNDLEGIEVEYITLPGWKTSLANIRKYDDLPENAKKYVKNIEDHVKVPGNVHSSIILKTIHSPFFIYLLVNFMTFPNNVQLCARRVGSY